MIKSVHTISKVLLTSFLVLVALVALAEEGKGDKKGNKNKHGATQVTDTVEQVLDVKAANQVDDTLVFEDWDSPEGGGGTGDGDFKSSDDGGSGDGNGTGDNPNIQSDAQTKEGRLTSKPGYRVEFTIYPNPAVNKLTINPDVRPESFIIKDIQGRIFQKDNYLAHIDISELTTGTYFIQLVYADQHIESRKFIKR